MRASVAAAWPKHVDHYEGTLAWMYLDTKLKVTTGTGNLIDTPLAAVACGDWFKTDGTAASTTEVTAEWYRVKALKSLASQSGWAYRTSAQMFLTWTRVAELLTETTARFWSEFVKRWPVLTAAPADAQLAALDLAWQNGYAFLELKMPDGTWRWPNMRAAFVAGDWAKAALAVPGTGARADARKRLFNNAARAIALKADPETLWDTRTPVAPTPPPAPPTPPKEPVMHSRQWNTDYVSWRGGYFAPQTVEKLKAIPSLVKVTQGGFSGAPASAQTHKGIGAYDLSTRGMSLDAIRKLCRELWETNQIPCMRGFSSDSFQGRTVSNINDGNEHLHVLDLDEVDHMHPEAQAQVREILAGGDGLLGSRPFVTHGRSSRTSWAKSPHNPANKPKPKPPVIKPVVKPVTVAPAKPVAKPVAFVLASVKGAVKVAAYNLRFPTHVKVVQTAINELGFSKVAVDGQLGPVTAAAVSKAVKMLGGHQAASGYVLTLPRLTSIVEAAEAKRAGDQYPPTAQG